MIYFGPFLLVAFAIPRSTINDSTIWNFIFCKEHGPSLNPDVLRRGVLYPALDRLGIIRSSRALAFTRFVTRPRPSSIRKPAI